MKLYSRLSRIGFLKQKYSTKFLFISFLGIHVPLIGLILFISFSSFRELNPGEVLFWTLGLTLGSTILTLWVQHSLIIPVIASSKALDDYLNKKELPRLPVHFEDEVGVLMRDLNEAIYTLDAHIDEKKDLVNMLSHDLRAPMSNILMLTELIRDDKQKKEMGEYLKMIDLSVQTQLGIVGTILQLMRAELQQNEFVEGVNIRLLIEKVISQFKTSLSLKNIRLEIDVPADLEATLNPYSIELLIYNLLSNAVKFSKPDGLITIKAGKNDDVLDIEVVDEGSGFDPKDAEALFEPFSRKSAKGTLGEGSIGIGLYFSRKIVQSHSGTITAGSNGRGLGSTFTVHIPAEQNKD
ncbi:hypothetical protein GS399_10625 [Pedobacter sp. HMF7647]|uniref:histidine kinase n=1 Tax=Hufsiella arboris TaxID=2695275 RepID=A0A7K1YA17_9SPHI|nr:HAMP domain-containing sensor histidine kinase [Hufsiella arboris]MXV51425.1 hypothetical protein [Hufsiella arboris]